MLGGMRGQVNESRGIGGIDALTKALLTKKSRLQCAGQTRGPICESKAEADVPLDYREMGIGCLSTQDLSG